MSAFAAGHPRLRARDFSFLLCFVGVSPAAWADFEEVRILRADPIHFQTCPPQMQAPQAPPPQPAGAGFTGKEVVGGVAGAAVGGLLGNQVGRGSGKTAATVAGAGIGAYGGYKLTEEKPQQAPPQQQAMPQQQIPPACTFVTHYRIQYARPNGMQGDVMMTSQPTGGSLMINFCGDRPCN